MTGKRCSDWSAHIAACLHSVIPLIVRSVRNVSDTWGLRLKHGALDMLQILGLGVALLLVGSGVWANFGGSSLSQYKGAWASHSH